jgi:hypothetical protein
MFVAAPVRVVDSSTFRRLNVLEPRAVDAVTRFDTDSLHYLHGVATPDNRAEAVHIDDLADPQFVPEVAEMMEAGAVLGDTIELSPEALMARAVAETGLDDFGDDAAFVSRVDAVLAALRDEANLSAFGNVTTSVQHVQLLKNRLLVQDLLTRHPEIRDIEIERPIIIAGLPRTGTTHLHNLLAADPALRSLPYWESLEPVLADVEQPAAGESDPRRARTDAGLLFLDAAAPHFKRMHEMTVDHVHEEIQLLAMDYSSMLFETTSAMPSLRDDYLARDQTQHYEYMKTVLKVLTWLRGGERWVLKSPQHIEQFGPLMAAFPDATVLVTHREPVAVTVSMSTMIAYTARMHLDPVDPIRLGTYWADRIERMLSACARDREIVPADQSMDIIFDDFMADDIATIERIYQLADQDLDDHARTAIADYRRTHQRDRYGRVVYEPAALGIDPDERRAALRPYTDRFLAS